jgi:hypothetical protein
MVVDPPGAGQLDVLSAKLGPVCPQSGLQIRRP